MSTPTITRPDQTSDDALGTHVGAGTSSDSSHGGLAPQLPIAAVGTTSPQTNFATTPKVDTSAGEPLPESTTERSTPNRGTSTQGTAPSSQGRYDAQTRAAAGSTWNGSALTSSDATPIHRTSLADPFLALAADVLDDAEQNRIANENRLRQLTRTAEDSDGEERGFGLDLTHPDVARLAAIVDMLAKVEHQAGLNLKRMLRAHPLGAWVQAQKGVGEKQAARLLAVVGDPYLGPDGSARTVSQLWAYCGHGDPARRKFKGMTQADLFSLGNPVAKSRLWLISCACLKAQGDYAQTYYARKDATVGREHAVDCVRCGPSGRPALAGSPWSDAHRHADALRVTGKTILRDLWVEAKRLHEEQRAAPIPSTIGVSR